MTNRKSLKRALVASSIALILCFTMLLGTTYAWFTDTVTSAGNIIKSGTLDIAMDWADGTEDPATATWQDASQGAIFNYTLWEPGYVQVRHISIKNVGTLALKYSLRIQTTGAASDLADVIDVYFIDPATQVTDRAALTDAYKVGTLAEVLAGSITGTEGELLPGDGTNPTTANVTIALKMQEGAGNEYQDKSIGAEFAIQLFATQLTYESDSFDEQYDKLATVDNEAELVDALAADFDLITLGASVALTDSVVIPADKTVAIDLNGYTISQSKECTASYSMIENKGTLTIKDSAGTGKVSFTDTSAGDPTFGWGSYTIRNSGTLVVENGTVEHLGEQNSPGNIVHMIAAIQHDRGSLTINDGTFSTPTYRSVRMNRGEMTVNGGTFKGQVWVQPVDDSCKLTINNGTFAPSAGDMSSVFVENASKTVALSITGGNFTTKLGASKVVADSVTGGTFADLGVLKYLADNANVTIKLANDVELSETVTIPASATVVLDLNGKNITMASANAVSMITNNGNLTINGTGKIAYTFTGTPSTSVAANTIANRGVMIVNGGEISNTGNGNQIGYAIDNYNGSTLTVNDGKITATGSSYYDAIRLFCGSNEIVVTVNGGEISSIWAQNPSDGKTRPVNGTVIVNGGDIGAVYYENYTTVQVKNGVTANVMTYGAGTAATPVEENGYTVYSFVNN